MKRRRASSPRSLAPRALPLLLFLLLTPGTASSAIFWSAEATLVHDTGPRLFLDVTIRSDGPVQGLAVSVHGYDATLLRFDASASVLSEDVLVAIPIAPGMGFGGLDGNTVRLPLTETIENGLGRVPFFEGRQLQGCAGERRPRPEPDHGRRRRAPVPSGLRRAGGGGDRALGQFERARRRGRVSRARGRRLERGDGPGRDARAEWYRAARYGALGSRPSAW